MSPTHPTPHRPRPRTLARGFTLVELLMAVVAGTVVAIAAFTLSKSAVGFFQNESRLMTAQLGATLGLNRLVVDIQRAGSLSSPNILKDPWRCDGGQAASWPTSMRRIAAVNIEKEGSVAAHGAELSQSTDLANNMRPDALVLSGSFNAAEPFPVSKIDGQTVYLQANTLPMKRAASAAAGGAETLGEMFRPGRFLRVYNEQGFHEWGIISGFSQPAGGLAQVTLKASPTLPTAASASCGYQGFCTTCLANPVSRILYDLRSVAGMNAYKQMVQPPAGTSSVTGDDKRTELVRVELLDTGNGSAEDLTTLDVVAEYAVDLRFGISVVDANASNPTVTRYPIAAVPSNAIYNDTGNTLSNCVGACTPCPEAVRSVQIRLTTRARVPDRKDDIPAAASGLPADGTKQRFLIPGLPAGSPRYARLRTHYAEVTLPNQFGLVWGGCP